MSGIAAAKTWNRRVHLVRQIPERFGTAQHQDVYKAVAARIYAPALAPDFAYVHWRDEYELATVERAYERARTWTDGFRKVSVRTLARTLRKAPTSLLAFRLMLGFTPQELAAATQLVVRGPQQKPVSTGVVKSVEGGTAPSDVVAETVAGVIERGMRGRLFRKAPGKTRSKLDKPDTRHGWASIRQYDASGVPLPVLLHQRHYGGAFRQLLDATSGVRGDLLEDAVAALFDGAGIHYLRTGSGKQAEIADRFGITIKPAPDFVLHDTQDTVKAILECKLANDGGTARDKAARFAKLNQEARRLGIPLFALLAGLGWQRAADALGPVVRDTDGRVFTLQTLPDMLKIEPLPGLRGSAK